LFSIGSGSSGVVSKVFRQLVVADSSRRHRFVEAHHLREVLRVPEVELLTIEVAHRGMDLHDDAGLRAADARTKRSLLQSVPFGSPTLSDWERRQRAAERD